MPEGTPGLVCGEAMTLMAYTMSPTRTSRHWPNNFRQFRAVRLVPCHVFLDPASTAAVRVATLILFGSYALVERGDHALVSSEPLYGYASTYHRPEETDSECGPRSQVCWPEHESINWSPPPSSLRSLRYRERHWYHYKLLKYATEYRQGAGHRARVQHKMTAIQLRSSRFREQFRGGLRT